MCGSSESRNGQQTQKANKTNKIDTDGGNVGFSIRVVCESQQEARLADTRVANKEQLEEVITEKQMYIWKGRLVCRRRRIVETYYSGFIVAIFAGENVEIGC